MKTKIEINLWNYINNADIDEYLHEDNDLGDIDIVNCVCKKISKKGHITIEAEYQDSIITEAEKNFMRDTGSVVIVNKEVKK